MKNSLYIFIAVFLFSCGGDTQKSSSNITQKKTSLSLDNTTTAMEGGYGFEPSLYIFSSESDTVCQIVENIASSMRVMA